MDKYRNICSTSFERLPDELLLIICSYLSSYHILKAFNDLNARLNSTISQYRQIIDLRELNLRQFHFFCKLIRFSFGYQIRSLTLSNSAPSVRQLIYFRKQIDLFTDLFSNLECLVLIDHYDDELDLYLPLISNLKHLKQLKINFIKTKNETTLCSFIPQILTDNFIYFDHLPKRRKRYHLLTLENLSLTGTGYLKLTPIFNETITYLTMEIENTDDLCEIFSGFHLLKYLNVNMKQLTTMTSNYSNIFHKEKKFECLSLTEFHCQVRWQPELFTFNDFHSILICLPNLETLICTFMSETSKDKLVDSNFIQLDKWTNICREFSHLIHLDCSIICPIKSSSCLETEFIRILAKISQYSNRFIDIKIYQNNEMTNSIKHDFTIEVDIQELHKMTGIQLANKLLHSQELTLYSDLFVDDEKIFSTFPQTLAFPEHTIFSYIRSLDLLGEFPNMNNTFLVKFIEQLIIRCPNLQSIGFFLYWVENMTDLVLNFLRPIQKNLTQIKKCYLYTEGDIDEKFVSELACLLPSLTLLSVKIDWYCNTADVINLILLHMKYLNHLELVLEDIPDYLDEDYIDRIKIEKEIETLAMTRDTREWLKRNTILGRKQLKKYFQAEKIGNDLKIWL